MCSLRALLFYLLLAQYVHGHGLELKVHRGALDIHSLGIEPHQVITQYDVGSVYTFEVYLDETIQMDYMVQDCRMNDQQIIGSFGCVECGQCVSQSIETESYNKPGAIKRTMIQFVAQETTIAFQCEILKLECAGCAERSCQRRDQLGLGNYHQQLVKLMYPPPGYPNGGAFPIPHNIYPTPPFGGYNMPPHSPVFPPPAGPPASPPGGPIVPVGPGGAAASQGIGAVWPWWIWLLLILLLLLLLCCLLALCLAAFLKRRRERKAAVVATVVDNHGKDCGVGTEKVAVNCVGTDTQDIVKIQPALALGAEELERHHHHHQQHNQYQRSQAEYDQGSVMAGGTYSLREGMVHEGYTRTLPRETYSTNDRYASRDRFERQMSQSQDASRFTDRSSFRNFAYERDMGRVEPMDGYDEVETRERTYCLSDDDQEIVEKNVKRTTTTRYVTESREYEHDNEERMRDDEYHHATYTHSLPV